MIEGNTYKERSTDQLNKWVDGKPEHNTVDDECCPDFSCCRPDFLQPKAVRETFKAVCEKADREEFNPDNHPAEDAKIEMLEVFLSGLIASNPRNTKVHIIGQSKAELN